jgi:seryl-tRNA synthetase
LTDCLNTWVEDNKNTINKATPLEKAIKRGKSVIEELKEIQKIIQKRIVQYQKDKKKYNLDKEETENINSDIVIFKENLEYIKNMINDISKDLLTINELNLTRDKIEKLEEEWEKLINIAKTYSPS